MTLQSISDLKASSRLSIVKNHENTYIRDSLKSLEVQSKWITRSKYPLRNKKYVKELDTSITLSVPIDEKDELYSFVENMSLFIYWSKKCPVENMSVEKMSRRKNVGAPFYKTNCSIDQGCQLAF